VAVGSGGVVDAFGNRRQGALVQDNIDVPDGLSRNGRVTHIGFDKLNSVETISNIAFFTGEQVVNNPDETALLDELASDIGADESGTACDKEFVHCNLPSLYKL
jgi:hypothetical protein